MFPNLSILAKVCRTIPVRTAAVECSFQHMKTIKSRLRNRLEENISHLMEIVLESPEVLTDENLEHIRVVVVWTTKQRRLS